MSSHYTVNVHTMSSDISCMCERERESVSSRHVSVCAPAQAALPKPPARWGLGGGGRRCACGRWVCVGTGRTSLIGHIAHPVV